MDPNFQKTHYFLDTSKYKRRKIEPDLLAPKDSGTHGTVFRVLSEETDEHVKHRFNLYEKVWSYQKSTIEAILGSANIEFFKNLTTYIEEPLSNKLDCAFLSLSSNTANNLRILDEFSSHAKKNSPATDSHIRIVRLNSKVCFNEKSAIKEVVKQVLREPKENDSSDHDVHKISLEIEEQKENDDVTVKDETDFEHASDDEEEEIGDEGDEAGEIGGGRILYDFEIVEDWVKSYKKKNETSNLRIVIVFDDADSFLNDVMNLLLQIFCVYSSKCPIKVVMGLITKNVSNWINSNITSKLRNLILGVKLEAKDNKDIGYRVIDEILLQNIITEQNPLLVSAHLSLIILNRFENSNNSIDSLITELQLSFMTYFYQLPLSALLDPMFAPLKFHYAALRKLPSFKTHIEYSLEKFAKSSLLQDKQYIMQLLEDDNQLQLLFEEAKLKFQKYQNSIMNAVNIIYWLCEGRKEKFEIYKLITNNQLINSPFLTDLLKSIKSFDATALKKFEIFLSGDLIVSDATNCTDDDVSLLKLSISGDLITALEGVTNYFNENKCLNMKINDNLFNEVLTISGGSSELDDQLSRFSIEENFENLMVNLIRPKLREVIEAGLDEPQKYLRNSFLSEQTNCDQGKRLLGPSLAKLYQIYKDAPVNINLWDFYTAFKQSMMKREIIQELESNWKDKSDNRNPAIAEYITELKDSELVWDKMTFSWFIQSCFELNAMGFVREKAKGDYMEKMIWRNL